MNLITETMTLAAVRSSFQHESGHLGPALHWAIRLVSLVSLWIPFGTIPWLMDLRSLETISIFNLPRAMPAETSKIERYQINQTTEISQCQALGAEVPKLPTSAFYAANPLSFPCHPIGWWVWDSETLWVQCWTLRPLGVNSDLEAHGRCGFGIACDYNIYRSISMIINIMSIWRSYRIHLHCNNLYIPCLLQSEWQTQVRCSYQQERYKLGMVLVLGSVGEGIASWRVSKIIKVLKQIKCICFVGESLLETDAKVVEKDS